MKTFKQFLQESLEKKLYEFFKGPYIYIREEKTLLKINDGWITDIIQGIPTKEIAEYFPNGMKSVLTCRGEYLGLLFPSDVDGKSLTNREWVGWYVIGKDQGYANIDPRIMKIAREGGWLVPATIDLGYEGWNLDKETKDDWRGIADQL